MSAEVRVERTLGRRGIREAWKCVWAEQQIAYVSRCADTEISRYRFPIDHGLIQMQARPRDAFSSRS